MLLTKKYQRLANFGNFCQNNKVEPFDLAELFVLIDRRYRIAVRQCNEGSNWQKLEVQDDKARHNVEQKAKKMGFQTTWPGLYPAFTKRGYAINLPQVD